MTHKEALEVEWVHRRLDNEPAEYPHASTKLVKVMGRTYTEAWIRYYAYARHHIKCIHMASYFAFMRTGGADASIWYSQRYVREQVRDEQLDLRLLYLNARLQIRDQRRKRRQSAKRQPELALA